jgi:hypothetical protein
MFKAKFMDRMYDPADYPQTEKETLYIFEEDMISWHICPCYLDDKIENKCPGRIVRLKMDTNWKFDIEEDIPTIHPSVSNVSLPCKSHYFLTAGELKFLPPTPEYMNPFKGQEVQLVKG